MMKNTNKKYEIKEYETLGIEKGTYYEVWVDGRMEGFAGTREGAERIAESILKANR